MCWTPNFYALIADLASRLIEKSCINYDRDKFYLKDDLSSSLTCIEDYFTEIILMLKFIVAYTEQY